MMHDVNLPLAAMAQRIARRHGHRASEVYAVAYALESRGMRADKIEWLLTEVADLGKGMSFKESMAVMARVAQEKCE